MKKIILTILFFVVTFNSLIAQSITWEKRYNNTLEIGFDICNADNGNFYIIGATEDATTSNYLIKIKPNGDTIWTRIIGNNIPSFGYSITESGDGGCIFSGRWDEAYTVKINSNGGIEWIKFYGGSNIRIWDIIKCPDNGYIACGTKDFNGYFFKIDSLGNFEWEQEIIATNYLEFYTISTAHNGGYVLCGLKRDTQFGANEAYIYRIDDQGNIIWDEEFNPFGSDGYAESIIKIDNGYLISGKYTNLSDTTGRVYILRTDTAANIYFSNDAFIPTSEILDVTFYDLKLINNNKYTLSLELLSQDQNSSAYILTCDSLGNTLNHNEFTANSYVFFRSILPTDFGDILFVGEIKKDNTTNFQDIIAIRTDSTLSIKPSFISNNQHLPPNTFALTNIYPNPFNPETTIQFKVGIRSHIAIKIYNITGEVISSLVDKIHYPGVYQHTFNGHTLSSGIYLVILYADNKLVEYKTTILLK